MLAATQHDQVDAFVFGYMACARFSQLWRRACGQIYVLQFIDQIAL
jgi:hypothetical protein